MNKLYRIHFGFSKSKRYPQAVELSKLAHQHEIHGEGENMWHTVSFTGEQADLMASLYKIAENLPGPKVHMADILYLIAYCRSNGHYDYSYASKAYKDRVRFAAKNLKWKLVKPFKSWLIFWKRTIGNRIRRTR